MDMRASRVAVPQHPTEDRRVQGPDLTWPCSCCSQPRMSHSPSNLDRSLVQGIAWRGGIKWFTQLVSWAATLTVARLIPPTDYGLFAMAMVYAGFVQLVNELGLSLAIVQRRDLTAEQIAQLGGLAVLASVVIFVLSLGLAEPVAVFFGEPAVQGIIIALSLTFVMGGVQVVPRSLLARDLEFRRLAWLDAGEAMVWSSVTLTGAYFGLGYWALVWGTVVSGFAVMSVLCALRPHRLAWPRDLRSIADAVNFGWYVVISQLCWYVYSYADLTIVGRVLVADVFVLTVLGERWRPAIVPLRLLGLYGGFRSIINLLPQMLIATGHAKLNMKLNVLTAAALPAMLYLGARWAGITGVALGWVIGYPLITIPSFFRHTLRILGLRASDYLRALWPAGSAAVGIAVVVLALRAIIPDTWSG